MKHTGLQLSLLTVLLSSCALQLLNSGGIATTQVDCTLPEAITISDRYTGGSNWMEYVQQADTSTVCNAGTDNQCLHAGEARTIDHNSSLNSCSGLTFSDNLDAFEWICNDDSGVEIYSNGFKDGKGLADLIDFDAKDFLEMQVSVTKCGVSVSSDLAKWWTNPIEEAPINENGGSPAGNAMVTLDGVDDDGGIAGDGSDEAYTTGTILTISSSRDSQGYFINLAGIGLVVKNGEVLRYGGSANTECVGSAIVCLIRDRIDFTWLEGEFNSVPAAGTTAEDTIVTRANRFSRLHNITVYNATSDNISVDEVKGFHMSQVVAYGAGASAINVWDYAIHSRFEKIYLASSPMGLRVNLYDAGNGNGTGTIMKDIQAHNITGVCHSMNNVAGATQINIFASGCDSTAYFSSGSDLVVIGLTSVGNDDRGVRVYSGSGVFTSGMTSANNALWALDTSENNNNFQNIALMNSFPSNHRLSAATNPQYSNILSTHSPGGGFNFYNTTNLTVSGKLMLGNNVEECGEGAGVVGGNINEGAGDTCTGAGFTKITGIDTTNSFVGSTSDSTNAHGGPTALFAALTNSDFLGFTNFFRSWSMAGVATVAGDSPINSAFDEKCNGADTCSIFDWSLSQSDTGYAGNPSMLNINDCPTGNDTMTHTWSDASTTTFLVDSYEQVFDLIGDDDGLCESNETCVYMPNIGAYQGHGDLVSASSISGCTDIGSGGTIENVTLLQFETNGY